MNERLSIAWRYEFAKHLYNLTWLVYPIPAKAYTHHIVPMYTYSWLDGLSPLTAAYRQAMLYRDTYRRKK